MRFIAIALCLAACMDEPPPATDEPKQDLIIPEELKLQPLEATDVAHSNCGHMVWCSKGGRAIYCYFNQAQTGCTLQNVIDDFNSDCQSVCGHTLCLNATIESCSSL